MKRWKGCSPKAAWGTRVDVHVRVQVCAWVGVGWVCGFVCMRACGGGGGVVFSNVNKSNILGITLRAVSSWKWVAKSVVQPMLAIKCSEMAHAKPKPSYVEVPLPSSSMMTSDRDVAPCTHPFTSSLLPR